jgi:hypothetical protein
MEKKSQNDLEPELIQLMMLQVLKVLNSFGQKMTGTNG